MPSIFPDPASGGIAARDAAGTSLLPLANVENAYAPPAAFGMTCPPAFLPSDCTARIKPAQINGLTSELLCLANEMDPTGQWDCNSTCNLAGAFSAYAATAGAVVTGLAPIVVTTGTTASGATSYAVSITAATTSARGSVRLATGSDYPQPTNDTDAATPAYVKAAIDTIPADKYLQGLQSYDPITNTMTLLMTDGSTVPVGMTGLITDALDTIPDDLLTPLANIAALTAADRGLSLGEVDVPTTRALTIAEMTAANSDNVGIPLVDMQSIYTNRAVEVTAPGLMNTNGTLGHAMRYSPVVGIAAVEAALITAVENNGSFVFASLTAGNTVVIPAPKYPGQVLEIRVALSGVYDEAILHFANQPSITGQYRNSQHKVTRGVGANDHIIIRSGETVRLTARSAAAGWDAQHGYYNFSGSGWNEFSEGGALLDFQFSGATNIPPGNRNTSDYALPVAIINPLAFYPVLTDANTTGVTNGTAPNSDAIFIYRSEPDGNTVTTFRVSSYNMSATGSAIGRTRAIGTVQSIDYASIGGVASF